MTRMFLRGPLHAIDPRFAPRAGPPSRGGDDHRRMLLLDIVVLGAAALAAATIVSCALRTGIAPMPSTPRACRAMLDAAADAPAGPVVDLGSGWGTLAIGFARRHPDREVIGYELSWVPWLVSSLLKRTLRLHNLSFRREDFLRAKLPAGAVLLCFLFPRGMQALASKLAREGCAAALVVSNTFALPGWRPHAAVTLDDLYRTRILVYRPPATASS